MKKIIAMAMVLVFTLLSGCSPSPTLATINGSKIDASEYAFYLNYQLVSVEDIAALSEENFQKLKEDALNQVIINELVLQKCKEYGLKLPKEDRELIQNYKKEFVNSLGGSKKYLEFLSQSAMTDRMYDKSQKNTYYYNMLMSYLTENPQNEGYIGFTDETLRKYFSENYYKVKYIYISAIGADGLPLPNDQLEELEKFVAVVAQGSKEPDKDFDLLIEKYNDDEAMRLEPDGFVYSHEEIANHNVFSHALELKENEVGGEYRIGDGFYIVKRIPVDAGYYDLHHDDILNKAIDERFNALMDSWKTAAKIKTSDIYNKITKDNYLSFVK